MAVVLRCVIPRSDSISRYAHCMDVLADVLSLAGVRGTLGARIEAGERWGWWATGIPGAAFHAVTSGTAWLAPRGRPPRQLLPGDVVLLPRGTEHALGPDAATVARTGPANSSGYERPGGALVRIGSGADAHAHPVRALRVRPRGLDPGLRAAARPRPHPGRRRRRRARRHGPAARPRARPPAARHRGRPRQPRRHPARAAAPRWLDAGAARRRSRRGSASCAIPSSARRRAVCTPSRRARGPTRRSPRRWPSRPRRLLRRFAPCSERPRART